jgi:hypothetical protein
MRYLMEFDTEIKKKLDLAISKMPIIHRMIARRAVIQHATRLAGEKGIETIGEEEVARAFFSTVPGAFKDQMMALLTEVGIDFGRYGLEEGGQ